MVDDHYFRVTIEVEEWVDAEPILLGEALDLRLGITSREAQNDFILRSGFSSIPVAALEGPPQPSASRQRADFF